MHSQNDLTNLSHKIWKLPTLPGVAIKILKAIQRETPSIAEIAEIISADGPLSAKVLKVVNSPLYGLSKKIVSVHQAMVYLGLNTVKNIALSFSLLRGFALKKRGVFDYVQFSKDSLVGAVAAKLLTEKVNRRHGENVFFIGLLQNIGIPIMVESIPDEYEKVIREAGSRRSPLHEIEKNLLGVDHMEIGEFVTHSWGLPAIFNVPIRFHHCPELLACPPDEIELLTRILHLSALYIDLFKSADLKTAYTEIEKYIQAYRLTSVVEKLDFAREVAEGVKSIFPIFELQIDEKKHIEIIEAAKSELIDLSSELLNELHSQAQCIDQLRQQAGIDSMTQLYNHERFMQILKEEITRATRYKTPLSIIMADVDHFKSINDFFGHQAGDHALKFVSSQLKKMLRESDHLFRYGGEEFAIILPMTALKDTLLTAERLRKSIESEKVICNERSISVTMSFGIASLEKIREIDVEGFIKMADEALYDAKNTGRNKCCQYKNQNLNQELSSTVLVIDDEEIVLVTITKMLERLGYAVIAANSGCVAADLLKRSHNKFDLVIMDMVMPDMNPDQILSVIRDQHNGTKILLSSGYSLSSESNGSILSRADGFLQKPYHLAELSRIVKTALNN